jgi:hypothetical protein
VGLLQTIEGSAFCTWVREADSLWAYPGILFVHVAGMLALVGLITIIALRVLGFPSDLPLAPFERLFPVVWLACGLNAASGAILLATDATAKLKNPIFGLKMLLVVMAAGTTVLMRRMAFGSAAVQGSPRRERLVALASIALWLAAMTLGRLMGYLNVLSNA